MGPTAHRPTLPLRTARKVRTHNTTLISTHVSVQSFNEYNSMLVGLFRTFATQKCSGFFGFL